MARIEGVDLPRNKRVEIGLTYFMGSGLRVRGRFWQKPMLILTLV